MTLPNFLIIGAAKSGTTALYRYLYDHPEVFMSQQKELHYFSYPETSMLTKGPESYHRVAVSSLEEYQSFFENAQHYKAIGEASPSYLYFPECAARIKKLLPDVRLIVILRNPVERAYSAYMHAIRDGWEPITDFSKALKEESKRINEGWEIVWHYTNAGFYYKQLQYYYNAFSKNQLRVYLYEDLSKTPRQLMKDIYGFLDVESSYEANVLVHPNVSGNIRNIFIHKIMNKIFTKPNIIKSAAQKALPESIRWRFTTTLRNLNIKRGQFPESIRSELIDIFRDDIVNLQDLIKRDLSSWL